MDDLNQAFGGQRPKTPVEEAWHQEQERKKYDIIRIKNPTSKDFYVKYDINQHQKVPANSTIDVPRYIALRYITHMKDSIINDLAKEKHDKQLAERHSKGFPSYKSKWEENQETYLSSDYPKTDDPILMKEIIDGLWVGLVYEFGRDVPPQNLDPRSGEVDLTSSEMKIVDSLGGRRVDPKDNPMSQFQATPVAAPSPLVDTTVLQPPVPSPFSAMNEKLDASEVTNNEQD